MRSWISVIGKITLCAAAVFVFLAPAPGGVKTARAAVACSSSAATQNGIKVAPSHGSVFYIDTGVTPVLDAGYVGYRVTNVTGSTQSDLWVQVSNFTGGKVTLNNSADQHMKLSSLTNAATGTAYFMLKATGATTSAQSHNVKVYNHRPDLSNASLLYECDFSFTKVQETIKAAANKVADNGLNSSAAIEVSDSSPELGQLLTITVEGQTGQIGQGSSPDFDIIWLTPAAISSWPTRALRLESVSATFDGNGNWSGTSDQVTYTDQLLITGADGLTNVDNSEYRISYNFRVIGRPGSSVQAVPVAQIASGTQVKHSDTGATGATLNLTFSSLAIPASLTKSVTATTGLTVVTCSTSCVVPGGTNGTTYVAVPYRLTASTTSTSTVALDEFIDTPATGIIYKPSSATITDVGRTAVAVPDPVYISSESSLDPRPYHFTGPFSMTSGTDATLNYEMWVPVGTYDNTAYAKIGDQLVGATQSAMSRITVTSTGTGTIMAVADTVSFSVSAVTDPATNIATTTATLNGTVDPNGAAILTGQFEYGTSPTLSGAATVTATTPASGSLNGLTVPTAVSVDVTGLSSGTTYYFRVKAGSAQGSILSFVTQAVQSTPTVTTTSASGVGITSATLNGTINPNLTPLTAVQFIYGTSPTLASGNTTVTEDDGTGTAALTVNGSSEQAFDEAIAGLATGTTYYYKIRACTSALSGTYPSVSCSSFVDGSIVSFTPVGAPSATTTAATSVTSSSARLNGTVNANGANAAVTFTYGTSSDLSTGTTTVSAGTVTGASASSTSIVVSGLSASTTYYFRVTGVNSSGTSTGSILNFTTLAASLLSRTLTIDGSSYASTYVATATPPTITSTASAGAGTKSYSSSTTGVCTINASSGLVAFVSPGTCTIGATITASGLYGAATATSVSFSVTLASRTHAIDGSSYASSYILSATAPTITSTPSAGSGTKSYSSLTPTVCTINASTGAVTFVSAGTCTIGASIASDGTYASANASTVSFTLTLASRTHAIDGSSYVSSYVGSATAPTITSTPSAGAGTKSYSSSTTGVCTINASSGLVAFVSPGTCTIGSSIAADGTYATATAATVSFSVTAASRTLTIDGSSYVSSYAQSATPPTITSTPSAGSGTKSYSSSTTGVCTINASSGLVAFVSPGTCTIGASISASGVYATATASTISFQVTAAVSGGGGGGGGGGVVPVAPSGLSLSIASGVSCTPSRNVTLSLGASDATDALVGDDAAFSGSSWMPISGAAQRAWVLPAGAGPKTVYAKFRNGTLQSSTISATITLDEAGQCGGTPSTPGSPTPPTNPPPSPPVVTPPASPNPPVSPNPPAAPVPAAPAESAEGAACDACARVSYDLYIVNPDGSERHSTTAWVKVTDLPNGLRRFAFEDATLDETNGNFDHNDVVIDMDLRDCGALKVFFRSSEASWKHRVRLKVFVDGVQRSDTLLATDDDRAIGTVRTLNVKPADVCAPAPKPVAALPAVGACARLSYDLYIVNPDGSERHAGTPWVRSTAPEEGVVRHAYEDATLDETNGNFDHNDVVIDMDLRDCAALRIVVRSSEASWRHAVRLRTAVDGVQASDVLIAADDDRAIGNVRTFDARRLVPAVPASEPAPASAAAPGAAPSAAACAPAPPLARTLAAGARGSDVRALQEALKCLGHFPQDAAASGYFGALTRAAVQRYQSAAGLDPIGIVGPRTRARLNAGG